jgi:hypothetical protein
VNIIDIDKSVSNCVGNSLEKYVWSPIPDSVKLSVWDSVSTTEVNSVKYPVMNFIRSPIRESVKVYFQNKINQ